jgi:hypothetical protein
MLELAHKQHGKLPWARLFEPAIKLAESGFPMSERLNMQLAAEKNLRNDAAAAAHASDGHRAGAAVGHVVVGRDPSDARPGARPVPATGGSGIRPFPATCSPDHIQNAARRTRAKE